MRQILILLAVLSSLSAQAQQINGAYAKALQQKYPSVKSSLCAACKLWVNPYFRSVADTVQHRPLVTHYIYTRAHRLQQEQLHLPRTGTYGAWTAGKWQSNETTMYRLANQQSRDMIAKGHCQPWILLAWCAEAAILSDTYTFNAAMEYQGQNIGTEIASEEFCRELTGYRKPMVTESVAIWCGTFGSQRVFTKNLTSVTMPAFYYKIIRYRDQASGSLIELCYWFPNQPDETRDRLAQRMITHERLVGNLGFDPVKVFN
jgi:hypothetical protein